MTATPKGTTQKFSVTSYNTYTPNGLACHDRIVARYDVEAPSLQKALDSAYATARAWNKNERRPNMIVKYVVAGGIVRTVLLPRDFERANFT